MNEKRTLQRWLVTSAASLVLAGSVVTSQAQTPSYIIDQFDTDTTGFYANQGWGTTVPTLSFSTNNATPVAGYPNTPGSGSLSWQSTWATASGDQILVERNFTSVNSAGDVLNFNSYTNISFDIQFQPDSATDGNGSYGNIEIDAEPQADGWVSTYINNYKSEVANGNGWIHVDLPISVNGNSKLAAVTGYGIKIQQNNTGTPLVGTTDFLIDNIILGGNSTPPPPPTVSIARANVTPGLLFVSAGGGNQYNRTLLEATDPDNGLNFSWIGSGNTPVTYAMTIANMSAQGPQAVMFLVPNGGNDDPAVDYDDANLVQLVVQENGDGSATAQVQYKTNQPDGNSQLSGSGNLASVSTTNGPLGTWSLTFLNDTNITLNGPGGISTNVNLPDEATAQLFVNPLTLYLGTQQGGTTNNIGQGVTYSEFSVTNITGANGFDDVFTNDDGALPDYWIVDSPTAPNNILYVDSTDQFWLTWTLPDVGYTLESATNLTKPLQWVSLSALPVVSTTLGNKVLLDETNLPDATQGYFNLVKIPTP